MFNQPTNLNSKQKLDQRAQEEEEEEEEEEEAEEVEEEEGGQETHEPAEHTDT